jgi:glutamine kinase
LILCYLSTNQFHQKNLLFNFDMSTLKNRFSSKSNVLKFLKPKLKKSKIEKIFDFTVEEWNNNNTKIIFDIQKEFNNDTLIIRSSAIGEDSVENSNAGNYLSIQNIPSKSKIKLQTAINNIIKSYKKKLNLNDKNQILIQNQTSDIKISGVIFTKTFDLGAPYYVINYEEGPSTIGVTSGLVSNTIKLFRSTPSKLISTKWKKLIISIQEIESIIGSEELDIEFGITKNNTIVIFQVRPITFLEVNSNKLDTKVSNLIKRESKRFSYLNKKKHVAGNFTIFSDMSDWNPAEIIGDHPNLLDYSLYDFLIMKKIWHQSRKIIGYQNIEPYPLMVRFGNKPYVDIRASFNSLIPSNFNSLLTRKLMNFFLKKLYENHHLHDKVEFEILFSCYDLTISNRLKELKKYDFSNNEIQEIKNTLIIFTNKIISDFPKIQNNCQKSIDHLTKNRELILKNLCSKQQNYKNLLIAAEQLLLDCRQYGTLPFATMARISFISSILLKSLKAEKQIPSNFVENFMKSISTPLSEIQNDVELLSKNKTSKNQFLHKYGHLRPGTYDITAARYDMEDMFFDNVKFLRKQKAPKILIDENLLTKILSKHGLKFININFLDFVKQSITQREKLKFEFTKNLSEAIELIAKAGIELGFSRRDMSYLGISAILSYKKSTKNLLKKKWQKQILSETKKSTLTKLLVLPPVITSKNDFYLIQYFSSKPNFVTSKQISENIIILNHFEQKDIDLEKKIVVIENADPGYDWIFTKNPSGLITKYGGVASHMSIRCAEIGLPAAIGCGEILYEQLMNSSKVLLDAKNNQVIIQEQKQHDEYVEERKVLKSLGYIK